LYELRGIVRRFWEREVLRIESLTLESGEIYALLGANGAGKSTLMRLLAFLDSPTSGTLIFRGTQVNPGQKAAFRGNVVWVPQFPVMFTGTLLYNVEYPMSLKKIAGPERKNRAMELLETVNLGHLAKAPAHRLSGGEAQRASIARALAAGAEIILFDEPTANVDQRSQENFIQLARYLWEKRGLSIIITTHNASLAAELCRRQIVLIEGRLTKHRVLADGTVAHPARLISSDGQITVLLPRGAHPLPSGGCPDHRALVLGIAEVAAGVALRLETQAAGRLELLLEDETSLSLSRALCLGSSLPVGEDHSAPSDYVRYDTNR
jgi:ABC-type multidrug transport system ATPase subunit